VEQTGTNYPFPFLFGTNGTELALFGTIYLNIKQYI
jgi:hypothetical protein